MLLNPDVRIKNVNAADVFLSADTVLLLVLRLFHGRKPFLIRSRLSSSVGFNHKVLAGLRGKKLAHRLQEFTPPGLGDGHHAWV